MRDNNNEKIKSHYVTECYEVLRTLINDKIVILILYLTNKNIIFERI